MMKYLTGRNRTIKYLLVFLIFIILIFIYYYGIFKYDYPVPLGDDGLRHMSEAQFIIDSGTDKAHMGSADPPLFHILLAVITFFTNSNIVNATKFFAPLLAILSIFTIYFIASRYFNYKIAVLSLFIFTAFSPQPMRIYEDGTYLNLVSAEYFLVFLLAILPSLLQSEKKFNWKNIFLSLIFLGAVLLSHSLSSIYLFIILLILTFFILLFLIAKRKFSFKNIIIIYCVVLLFLPFIWNYYIGMMVEKIGATLGIIKLSSENILQDFGKLLKPASFGTYIWHHTYFLIITAIGGVICSLIFLKNKYPEKLILFIWIGALLIGSQSSFFQLPTRFARDMAIPIGIFSGIFFYYCFKFVLKNSQLVKKISVIAISIFSIFLFFGAVNKIKSATKYNSMERLQKSDKRTIEWIKNNTSKNDVILAMAPTVVNGSWGSYIELMTSRKTLDGGVCPKDDDNICDPIYYPTSSLSIKYYKKNDIDYVYAGKKILGSYLWKDRIDWSYQKKLSQVSFLEQVAVFKESKKLGKVIIFKVDKSKLD